MAAIFIVGEYGPLIPLQCNLVFDPTGAASHSLEIYRPRGASTLVVPGASLTVATTYVRYAFAAGEVSVDGRWGWLYKGTYAGGSVREDYGFFDVAPAPVAVPVQS